ncbi:hypothetical protein Tco_1221892 [Tanacetum coccineum]
MRDIVRTKIEREFVRVKIPDGNAFWNKIRVNAGISKLMLLSLNLQLPVLVYAARHSLTAVRHKLMLLVITSYYWKPEESNGFEGIIDFLNASSNKYALTVNPTVYESCIKQFWETAKAKIVNGEHQIQALPGMNLVALWHLLSSVLLQKFNFSKYIFDNMMKNFKGGVKFLMYPRFVQVFLDNQVEGMTKHKGIYVTPSHTKKVFANMKREGKGFSGKVTPLFQTMMVQAPEDMGEDSATLTDSHTHYYYKTIISKPQKKKSKRNKGGQCPYRSIPDEATNVEEHKGLDLRKQRLAQAKEVLCLKKRVSSWKKEGKSRTSEILFTSKGLRKGGSANSRNDEEMLFDVQDEEVVAEKEAAEKEVGVADPITNAGEVVTNTNIDELTLAQTLIEIKTPKPKAITIAATTTTTTRPKAKGL